MSGLSVLVVDDEPLARRRLLRLLAKVEWIERASEASNVIEARERLVALHPDILLLDIQMPGGDGFDLLKHLPPTPPAVIFVTAFDHHALRAFEANAIDYVTKPIQPARLLVALDRAREAAVAHLQVDRITELQEALASLKQVLNDQVRYTEEFWVRARGEYLRIGAGEVVRFQAERDYVRLHARTGDYLYQETLASLERKLNPEDFLRVHRGTIVRRSAIQRVKQIRFASLIAVLSDGAEVRIGRTYTAAFRAHLTAPGRKAAPPL